MLNMIWHEIIIELQTETTNITQKCSNMVGGVHNSATRKGRC